jgi:hypothetical protein
MPNFKDKVTYEHTNGVKAANIVVQEADIAFSDSAKALMTIPDGAKIQSISVITTTGFNGTTPTYHVGYAASPQALVSGGAMAAAAGHATLTAPAATAAQWNGVTSGRLIGTFAGGGTNTTGAGKIRVTYFLP